MFGPNPAVEGLQDSLELSRDAEAELASELSHERGANKKLAALKEDG